MIWFLLCFSVSDHWSWTMWFTYSHRAGLPWSQGGFVGEEGCILPKQCAPSLAFHHSGSEGSWSQEVLWQVLYLSCLLLWCVCVLVLSVACYVLLVVVCFSWMAAALLFIMWFLPTAILIRDTVAQTHRHHDGQERRRRSHAHLCFTAFHFLPRQPSFLKHDSHCLNLLSAN